MRKKRNRYGAKRIAGYASRAEYARSLELKQLLDQGKIKDLREQVSYDISPASCEEGCYPIRYIADFVYNDHRGIHGPKGIEIVEDVKGKILDVFKLKLKLFLCKYPKTNFVISKAVYSKNRKDILNFNEEIQCQRKKKL